MSIETLVYTILVEGVKRSYLKMHFRETFSLEYIHREVLKCWSEPHRYWHTLAHLAHFLKRISELFSKKMITEEEFYTLSIAAIYHDIVYIPGDKSNEVNSAAVLYTHFAPSETRKAAAQLIMHTAKMEPGNTFLEIFMFECDWYVLLYGDMEALLQYEEGISKEFGSVSPSLYREGRIAFLEKAKFLCADNQENIQELIKYIQQKYLTD